MQPDCSRTRLNDPAPRVLRRLAEYDALEAEARAFGMSPEQFRREVFDPSGSMEEARHLLRQWVARVLAPDPEPAGDILSRIDATVEGLCPCGATPRPGSAWCSEDCEPTHIARHTEAAGMRWRPDLVAAFDDSDLELVEELEPGGSDPFTRRWYLHADGRRFLRLDDGHRWVGAYCEDTDVEAGREMWRRLERELTDARRLDPDPQLHDVTAELCLFQEAMEHLLSPPREPPEEFVRLWATRACPGADLPVVAEALGRSLHAVAEDVATYGAAVASLGDTLPSADVWYWCPTCSHVGAPARYRPWADACCERCGARVPADLEWSEDWHIDTGTTLLRVRREGATEFRLFTESELVASVVAPALMLRDALVEMQQRLHSQTQPAREVRRGA